MHLHTQIESTKQEQLQTCTYLLASTSTATKTTFSAAVALAVLLFGIRWFMSDRDKVVAALNVERNARITALEESSKRCSEDRAELHKQICILQTEVRELLKAQIKEAHASHAVDQVAQAINSPNRSP